MSVAIIILNWNDADDTLQSIDSALQQSCDEDFDIFVADNNSLPDDRQKLIKHLPKAPNIHLRLFDSNMGFGNTHNLIFYELLLIGKYRCWALLNNDAFAHDNWLRNALATFDREAADAVACKMIKYFEPHLLDSAGLVMLNVGDVLPRGNNQPADLPEYNCQQQVISFCGGACLLRPQTIAELGGFDKFFTTGYEDVELGLRLFVSGKKIVYEPTSVVSHKGSVSVDKIANEQRAVKILRDINYIAYKTLPTSVIIINTLCVVPRSLAMLLLHFVSLRWRFIKIWIKSIYQFFGNDARQALRNKTQCKIDSCEILDMQANFIATDFERFKRYFLHRQKHQFERMTSNKQSSNK